MACLFNVKSFAMGHTFMGVGSLDEYRLILGSDIIQLWIKIYITVHSVLCSWK